MRTLHPADDMTPDETDDALILADVDIAKLVPSISDKTKRAMDDAARSITQTDPSEWIGPVVVLLRELQDLGLDMKEVRRAIGG